MIIIINLLISQETIMIDLYDKSRQLRVHMAIIESQVKFAKDKATRINKGKPNPQFKALLFLDKF